MKKFLYVCIIGILVAACSPQEGLQQPPKGPYYLQRHPSHTPMQQRERLIALDKSAADALLYVNHEQSRLPSGQVYIQINLQNRSADHDIWMDWKVVFYDNQDFQIEETEWNSTYFPAKEIQTLKVNSIRRDVVNFTVMLQTPSNEKGEPYIIQKEYVR